MISAVLIVKNEAERISECLQAAAQVADELIVVDHHSEDDTVALAKAAGAQVHIKTWEGYAAGKNFGNENAKHPWILSLDADEILSESLIESIKALKLTDPSKVYALDRANYFGDKWVRFCGWYPDWKVRLFHRDMASWEGDFVHERLRFAEKVQPDQLIGKLLHYSYRDESDHWQRIERYAQLGAEKILASGKNPSWLKQSLSPAMRFIRTYFFKLGFLDGRMGWLISKRNAQMVSLKYKLLAELRQKKQA